MPSSVVPRVRSGTGWFVAYVPLTFLAFPERIGDTVIDLGLWLGPLSVMALLLGLGGDRPARAARRAFLAGWLANAAVLHWIFVVTVRYGGAPSAVGVLAVLALALYPAAATAAIGAAVAWLRARGLGHPVALAAVFVLADHLSTFVATGFPWALLGNTQLDNPALLPLARFGAVYAVGFGVALGGALLAGVVGALASAPGAMRGLRSSAVLWLVLHAIGLLVGALVAREESAERPTVRVAALQGSVEQARKWSPEAYQQTLERYETLTRAAAAAGAELVAWPETAVPGMLELDGPTARRVGALARQEGVAMIVGSVGVEVDPATGRVSDFFDSAFAVEPDGRFVGRYDKGHLVPFGEYVPFRGLLGRFLEAVARGVATGDVSAGDRPVAMRLYVPGRRDAAGGGVRVGVPICYELLFPDWVRQFVADEAELLVAITNDAWYGRSGAPHQFLAITRMRAAETGVALVRAANTGVSAIIDGQGQVRAETALFERGFVIADVPLSGSAGPTFYTRYGNGMVYALWAAMALWVGLGGRWARRD